MPLYDFQCRECGEIREFMVPLAAFAEERISPCPNCGTTTLHELVVRPPAVDDWGQGRWFEHLGPKGMTFYDRRSYKEHLRSKGLVEWSPKTGMPGSGV